LEKGGSQKKKIFNLGSFGGGGEHFKFSRKIFEGGGGGHSIPPDIFGIFPKNKKKKNGLEKLGKIQKSIRVCSGRQIR
jgi:hypothetical protein